MFSKCLPFAATQAPGASLQGEDSDCGGVAASHYGGVGMPRPTCHRQRVKHWSNRHHAYVAANGGHFNIFCECHATFAYNAEFYCHTNLCSCFVLVHMIILSRFVIMILAENS